MILKEVEIWYPRLKTPSSRFSKTNPEYSIQLRTSDKAVKQDWVDQGLNPKVVVDEDTGRMYWKLNLSKKSLKSDGSLAAMPTCVGPKLDEINPDTVGNGSIADIRIFMREYTDTEGRIKYKPVIQGIQLRKLIERVPFEKTDIEEFDELDVELEIVPLSPDEPAF
jgi:hypothetical protein